MFLLVSSNVYILLENTIIMTLDILVIATPDEFRNMKIAEDVEKLKHDPPRFHLLPLPNGLITPASISEYIVKNTESYAAVAVFDPPLYEEERQAIEELDVKRILLSSSDNVWVDRTRYHAIVPIPCINKDFGEAITSF